MQLAVQPIAPPPSLAGLAYDTLKEFLLSSDLDASQKLDERALAQRLGISRTPLREAIQKLALEGFLKVEPRRGVFVNYRSKEEIVEILYVRAALEAMAARLTVRYVTPEDIESLREIFIPFHEDTVEEQVQEFSLANVHFHEKALELSRCSKIVEMASNIQDQMRMVRIYTMRSGGRAENSLAEHLQIIDALEQKNADLAAKRMREHILGLANYVEQAKGPYPWTVQSRKVQAKI